MALVLRPRSKRLLSFTLFVLQAQLTCVSMTHAGKDGYHIEYITDQFEKGGITAVKFADWKNVKINISIIGNSGTGKSSFINAILGLTADDEGAAEVGVTLTTKDITHYHHPSNSQLVLWDLPGLGTPTYNREHYFDQVKVNTYDYFVIITADRFRDDDKWLATELNAKGRHFYFVRTKVGQDIANNKRSHPKTHTDNGTLDKIRTDCEINLQNISLKNRRPMVYLIDSYEPEKYDFDLLSSKLIEDAPKLKKEAMIEDAPKLKKEAMILSMTVLTESVILFKKETLFERIHYLSLVSPIAGAIPIPVPLLDSVIDIGIVFQEAMFYRKQLGLDKKSLARYAMRSNMSMEQLITFLNLRSPLITLSAKGLLSYLAKKGITKAATLTSAKYVKYLLPIFGSVVSGAASYTVTSWCLHDLLDVMVEDATKINKQFNV